MATVTDTAPAIGELLRGWRRRRNLSQLELSLSVYDALYAYCREKAAAKPRNQATPRPRLSYRQRFAAHVDEPQLPRTESSDVRDS